MYRYRIEGVSPLLMHSPRAMMEGRPGLRRAGLLLPRRPRRGHTATGKDSCTCLPSAAFKVSLMHGYRVHVSRMVVQRNSGSGLPHGRYRAKFLAEDRGYILEVVWTAGTRGSGREAGSSPVSSWSGSSSRGPVWALTTSGSSGAEALGAGAALPPIVVVRGTSWFVDGLHRLEAHRQARPRARGADRGDGEGARR